MTCTPKWLNCAVTKVIYVTNKQNSSAHFLLRAELVKIHVFIGDAELFHGIIGYNITYLNLTFNTPKAVYITALVVFCFMLYRISPGVLGFASRACRVLVITCTCRPITMSVARLHGAVVKA